MGMRWRRANVCCGIALRATAALRNVVRLVHAYVLALYSLLCAAQQSGLKFGHIGIRFLGHQSHATCDLD